MSLNNGSIQQLSHQRSGSDIERRIRWDELPNSYVIQTAISVGVVAGCAFSAPLAPFSLAMGVASAFGSVSFSYVSKALLGYLGFRDPPRRDRLALLRHIPLLTCLLSPGLEELIFRKGLQFAAQRALQILFPQFGYSILLGRTIAAITFGVLHLVNVEREQRIRQVTLVFQITVVGFLLGQIADDYGVFYSTLTHMSYNTTVWCVYIAIPFFKDKVFPRLNCMRDRVTCVG